MPDSLGYQCLSARHGVRIRNIQQLTKIKQLSETQPKSITRHQDSKTLNWQGNSQKP
jgi:hypothetical protein